MDSYEDLGRYQIIRSLGAGAFGQVFLANDKTLERRVAIKILNGDMDQDGENRFIREVEICLKLRHPNVITIYDGSVTRGKAYIAMEYLASKDLGQILSAGPMSIEKAVSIVDKLADALIYLHSENIIHRDVKPQNVMLKDDDEPVLMDFNLGLDLNRTALTNTGLIVGTPQYMAPEIAAGMPYSGATEVYALGVLFHNLLAGSVASFQGDGPPLSELNSEVTQQYEEFINWVTNPSPASRCRSMKEFKKGLAKLQTKKGDRTELVEAVGSGNKDGRKRSLPFVLGGLLILVLIFLAFFWVGNPHEQENRYQVNVCAFPDGFYAALSGFKEGKPSWQVLRRQKTKAGGHCFARGNTWVAEAAGFPLEKGDRLEFLWQDKVLTEKAMEFTPSAFIEPLRARVGKSKVILNWRLKGGFKAQVKGVFKGAKNAALQKSAVNEAVFQAENEARVFDYELFLGKRRLAKHSLALGLVCRRDKELFPKGVPWKIYDEPLVVGKKIIAYAPKHFWAMEIVHLPRGPEFKVLWSTNEGQRLQFFQAAKLGTAVHLLYRDREDLWLSRLDLLARKRLGLADKTAVGELPSESKIPISSSEERATKATIGVGKRGKIICLVRWVNQELEAFELKEGKVRNKYRLGKVTDFQQVNAGNEAGVLILRDRELIYKKLSPPHEEQKMLELKDGGLLLPMRKGSPSNPAVELEMTQLDKERYALRAGKNVGFFALQEDRWTQLGSILGLPVRCINRTSSPMLIGRDKVIYAVVNEPDHATEQSNGHFVAIDLVTNKMDIEKVHYSYVARNEAATCGRVAQYTNRYYLPILEQILVVSKDNGQIVDKYLCDWSARYALSVDGTLFATLKSKQLLGMDLIDY